MQQGAEREKVWPESSDPWDPPQRVVSQQQTTCNFLGDSLTACFYISPLCDIDWFEPILIRKLERKVQKRSPILSLVLERVKNSISYFSPPFVGPKLKYARNPTERADHIGLCVRWAGFGWAESVPSSHMLLVSPSKMCNDVGPRYVLWPNREALDVT